MRTELFVGPPGTGKTTRLISEVEHALAQGIAPDRIAYLSFTKVAAQEAISRAAERFSFSEEAFPHFRTLHSLAYRELNLSREDVVQQHHLTDFGRHLGTPFLGDYDSTMERLPYQGALGDRCLSLYSLAKSMRQDIETTWWRGNYQDLPLSVVTRFCAEYDQFKEETSLLDFTDFLDQCQSVLDVDVFIVDEAQDLTLQQWNFARRAGRLAPRILIAGDDDQAIFTWAGADLKTLIGLRGRKSTLPQSHRVPRSIYRNVLENIVARIKNRFAKVWSPRPADGSVGWLESVEQTNLRVDGSWMLLARHKHFLTRLEDWARSCGVVYRLNGLWSNQTPEVRAVVNYEKLRRGERLPLQQGRSAIRYCPDAVIKDGSGEVGYDDILWKHEGQPIWYDAMKLLGAEVTQYVRALRRNGESLSSPGRVVVSTIHGVKGAEADNVVLMTDVTAKVHDQLSKGNEGEQRVWYVGASRARENLYLVQPSTTMNFTI
jgi:DNA helicase-2/ATP-dependent DNA helicase PcrA